MISLYPLKFKPIFKEKIWGGDKLKTVLKKDFAPLSNCGETWELSTVKDNISEVENGLLEGEFLDDLISSYGKDILGEKVAGKYGKEFPLLIKFIDASKDLSVQVHPDDELARIRHQESGKTEMWYILQADNGASVITGFNQPLDRDLYLNHFNNADLETVLNKVKVQTDDVFYIPAGRIHTIGKGILLAEIQQTSDITYRIYDFDRTDADGNKRELHVSEALDALDYTFYDNYKTSYTALLNDRVSLVQSSYFTTNKLDIDKDLKVDYSEIDSFVIYIFIEGEGHMRYNDGHQPFRKGDVYLIPASMKSLILAPKGRAALLEVYLD